MQKMSADNSQLEIISSHFQSIPVILILELGHIPELNCTIKDIDDFIYITENERTLCYKLAGYTLSLLFENKPE